MRRPGTAPVYGTESGITDFDEDALMMNYSY
jgi:hypothetical protein